MASSNENFFECSEDRMMRMNENKKIWTGLQEHAVVSCNQLSKWRLLHGPRYTFCRSFVYTSSQRCNLSEHCATVLVMSVQVHGGRRGKEIRRHNKELVSGINHQSQISWQRSSSCLSWTHQGTTLHCGSHLLNSPRTPDFHLWKVKMGVSNPWTQTHQACSVEKGELNST